MEDITYLMMCLDSRNSTFPCINIVLVNERVGGPQAQYSRRVEDGDGVYQKKRDI